MLSLPNRIFPHKFSTKCRAYTNMRYGKKTQRSAIDTPTSTCNISASSLHVPSIKSQNQTHRHYELKPKNRKQQEYLNYLNSQHVHIVFATGCAGTGKTFMAVSHAMEKLLSKEISKIIITRPMIAVDDKNFGALPGDVIAKTLPYILPIYDVMHKYISPQQVQNLISKSVIEICPLMYMRGRSFEDTFIIADEMQNSSPNQTLMLLTRLGKNSKMVVTGDIMQHDRGSEISGLADVLKRLENNPQDGINTVHFTEKEVERNPMVVKVLGLYNSTGGI